MECKLLAGSDYVAKYHQKKLMELRDKANVSRLYTNCIVVTY
jgi:hypothetical protein